MKALRNVICVICNRAMPEQRAVRAGAGRAGIVPVWVCRRCERTPEAGIAERRVAQERERGAGSGERVRPPRR